MTFIELIRKYFPDISDRDAEAILWEETGYPAFWDIPEDGNTPEECCRKQLQEFKDKLSK